MILLVQFCAGLFGFLGVLFGAFGAHRLKRSFTPEQLQVFETGVRYQLLHAVVLVVLGFNFGFTTPLESFIAYAFILGTFLFSFSLYALAYAGSRGKKFGFLGPVTPIGGVLLLTGWGLLLYKFVAFIF